MAMQMYFVALKGEFTQDTSRTLQRLVRERSGFILMVTRNGPLVALDTERAPEVEKHPLVSFLGPVMLNPRGIAAQRLQQIFAQNLSKQLDLERLGVLETEPPQGG